MDDAPLDNPIWSALNGRHRDLADGSDGVMRYPADIAPFLGIADADRAPGSDLAATLEALVPAQDTVYLLGVAPCPPTGWRLRAYRPLAQMISTEPMPVPDGPPIIPLSQTHHADVLALTALVYPHYFRVRTMTLGRYFGMYVDGRLAAMIGERLGADCFQEVSAICTHPDFNGRGYARRMTAMLSNDILAQGRIPFLHVSYDNARAKALYDSLGYRLRDDIGFWSLRRP